MDCPFKPPYCVMSILWPIASFNHLITNDSIHFDRKDVKLIIRTSDSVAGVFTFFRARPCYIAYLFGHLLVFIIDLNNDATGLASSTGNSFISFLGKSPGTPADLGFFALFMAS